VSKASFQIALKIMLTVEVSIAGLHNSESSKRQIINVNLLRAAKSISFRCRDFVVVWGKFWNDNYVFEVELFQHLLHLTKLSRATRKTFVCCASLICYCKLRKTDSFKPPSLSESGQTYRVTFTRLSWVQKASKQRKLTFDEIVDKSASIKAQKVF